MYFWVPELLSFLYVFSRRPGPCRPLQIHPVLLLFDLFCSILSCYVLFCPVSFCFFPVLSYFVLFCPILSFFVLFCPVLSCFVLFHPVPSCFILFPGSFLVFFFLLSRSLSNRLSLCIPCTPLKTYSEVRAIISKDSRSP